MQNAKWLFLGVFLIFGFAFFMVAPARAAHDLNLTDSACPNTWQPQYGVRCFNGRLACGTAQGVPQCVPQVPTCSGGATLNCDTCACACPSPKVECAGRCTDSVAGQTCDFPDAQSISDGVKDACGACVSCASGFLDCRAQNQGCITASESAALQAAAQCGENQTPTACGGCTELPFTPVYLNYYQTQGGGIKITGDLRSVGGDLLLNSGKAVRVDLANGASSLNIGNWAAGGQGANVSVLGNLTVGAPNFNRNLTVLGDLGFSGTLISGTVPWTRLSTFPSACPSGQYVTAVGGTLTCAPPPVGGGGGGGIIQETDPLYTAWYNSGNPTLSGLTVNGATTLKGDMLLSSGRVLAVDGPAATNLQILNRTRGGGGVNITLDGNLNLGGNQGQGVLGASRIETSEAQVDKLLLGRDFNVNNAEGPSLLSISNELSGIGGGVRDPLDPASVLPIPNQPVGANIFGNLSVRPAANVPLTGQLSAREFCLGEDCRTAWPQGGGGGGVTGSGTAGVLSKFTGASTLGDSRLSETAEALTVRGNLISSGAITSSGNLQSTAGDILLASGKAVRVDGAGTTALYVGNWGAQAAGVDTTFLGNLTIGTAQFNRNLNILGNASLSGGLEVGGPITATGCVGPIFVGLTAPTQTVDGNQGGYQQADTICTGAFAGSHVCSSAEILASKSCDAPAFMAQNQGAGWILTGPPGFTANANDCVGRTSALASDLGSYWIFNNSGGQGWLSSCDEKYALACCR